MFRGNRIVQQQEISSTGLYPKKRKIHTSGAEPKISQWAKLVKNAFWQYKNSRMYHPDKDGLVRSVTVQMWTGDCKKFSDLKAKIQMSELIRPITKILYLYWLVVCVRSWQAWSFAQSKGGREPLVPPSPYLLYVNKVFGKFTNICIRLIELNWITKLVYWMNQSKI